MNRALTTREKVMLTVLTVLLIGMAYYKLLLEPINQAVEQYQLMTAQEQDSIAVNTSLVRKKREMEAELEALFDQGSPTPIPLYDNSGMLMVELHTILADTVDYTLSFGDVTPLSCQYLLRRPVQMKFTTETYQQARHIIDRIHDSDNLSQISNLSYSRLNSRDAEEGYIEVNLVVTYFERS